MKFWENNFFQFSKLFFDKLEKYHQFKVNQFLIVSQYDYCSDESIDLHKKFYTQKKKKTIESRIKFGD